MLILGMISRIKRWYVTVLVSLLLQYLDYSSFPCRARRDVGVDALSHREESVVVIEGRVVAGGNTGIVFKMVLVGYTWFTVQCAREVEPAYSRSSP